MMNDDYDFDGLPPDLRWWACHPTERFSFWNTVLFMSLELEAEGVSLRRCKWRADDGMILVEW